MKIKEFVDKQEITDLEFETLVEDQIGLDTFAEQLKKLPRNDLELVTQFHDKFFKYYTQYALSQKTLDGRFVATAASIGEETYQYITNAMMQKMQEILTKLSEGSKTLSGSVPRFTAFQ
jgi:hypothetical protein